MGRNIPEGRKAGLNWMEAHLSGWGDNAAAIGLTSATVTELGTDIANARQAFISVEQARETALTKTQAFYTETDTARKKAAEAVLSIKAFAENTDNPAAVYTLAGITGSKAPGPAVLPDQASILNASLGGDGSVTVNYIGTGPIGTAWQVSRKLGTESEFVYLGNADARTKSFRDATVPSGTAHADYRIVGVRGSIAGPVSFSFNVKFGSAAPAQQGTEAA